MKLLSLFLALSSLALATIEQRADTPILKNTYPKISFGHSRADINSYTKESIQSLLKSVNQKNGQFLGGNPDSLGQFFFWQSVNGWATVAQYDLQLGQKGFSDAWSNAQGLLAKNPGGGFDKWGVELCNEYNDDCGWAGLTSLIGYEAYGDPIFLQRAVGIYDFISAHGYVDQAGIDTGYLKGTKLEDTNIKAECNGKTMLGGVYWMSVPDSPDVNAVSTGNYGLLAVELCRLTGDMKYCDRATETAQWLDNHMVNPEGLLWDHYNGKNCELKDWVLTYNTGLYIALRAELGFLKKDSAATKLAERTAIAAMTTGQWNTEKGIIKEGDGSPDGVDNVIAFKPIMIRYLAKAYPWLADEGVKAAILQYINIQYWAMTTRAADSSSHPVNYGRNWTGPAFDGSNVHTQIAALDVLNGIQLNPDSLFAQ